MAERGGRGPFRILQLMRDLLSHADDLAKMDADSRKRFMDEKLGETQLTPTSLGKSLNSLLKSLGIKIDEGGEDKNGPIS